MIDPFKPAPAPAPTKNAILTSAARRIEQLLKETAKKLREADAETKRLLWASEGCTGEEVIARLAELKIITPALLQDMAVVGKTYINRYWPGTIVDTVPEAKITMPG